MVTSAFLGAGVMALTAGAGMDDVKAQEPTFEPVVASAQGTSDVATARDGAAERASRSDERASLDTAEAGADRWVLPLHNYQLVSAENSRWARANKGIDMSVPEGADFSAVHGGTVSLAGWNGAFGLCVVVDHGDGVQTLYAHASELDVAVGQQIKAGDVLGAVGRTGHTLSPHLHLEVHANGVALDAAPWLAQRGLDFNLEIESGIPG